MGLSNASSAALAEAQLRVLNVGGNSKEIPIPEYYAGWEHLLLDIDPRGTPDIVCDARLLTDLPATQFDAIYCSHNLEHYYAHDVQRVLQGFLHTLKSEGFADVRVPDMRAVMQATIDRDLDIEDVLYVSPAGPITVLDVTYGYGVEIEETGNDFFAHKTGFSPKSLVKAFEEAGFGKVFCADYAEIFEIRVLAFKTAPAMWQCDLLGLPNDEG